MKNRYVIYNHRFEAYLSHDQLNLELCYNKILDQFVLYYDNYEEAFKYCNMEEEVIKII